MIVEGFHQGGFEANLEAGQVGLDHIGLFQKQKPVVHFLLDDANIGYQRLGVGLNGSEVVFLSNVAGSADG